MPASGNRSLYLQVGGDVSDLKAAMKDGRSALLDLVAAARETQDETTAALRKISADPAALKQMVSAYEQSFAQIARNARAALSANDNPSALKIIDATGAQQQAAAMAAQASQLRVLATAAATVADRQGEAGIAARVLASTLEVQAIEAAKVAAAMRGQAEVLAEVAAEAKLAGAREDELGVAHGRMGASGMITKHVIRSMSDSIAAGQSPVRALTMEMGRITEAMTLYANTTQKTEGLVGRLATAMSGGLGIAISASVAVLTTLVAAFWEDGEATKADTHAKTALEEAVDRLVGAQAALDHSTRQGIIDEINAAEATRQREIRVRKLIDAQLDLAKANLQAALTTQGAAGGSVPGAMFSAGVGQEKNARADIAALEGARAINDQRTSKAELAIRVARGQLIAMDVKDAADPQSAVRSKYGSRVDQLTRAHDAGKLNDADYKRGMTKATEDRDDALDALKPARRGRVDHSAKKAANQDRAYQGELGSSQQRLARANLALSDTAENRLKVELDELKAASDRKDEEIGDQVDAKKITEAEAQTLYDLNYQATLREEEAATRKEQQAILDRTLASDEAQLNAKDALLALQEQLATTEKERREIALQRLAIEEEKLRKEGNRGLASTDPATREKGAATLKAIDDQHGMKNQAIEEAHAGPLAQFRKGLEDDTADMNVALQRVEADGLKGLEDGLLGVLDGTKSLAGAFEDMTKSILADLAKIAIEKALVAGLDAIFPGAGQIFGGAAGKKDGGLIHLATGGMVFGPGGPRSDDVPAMLSAGEFVINAAATAKHLPLLRAINTGSLPGFADGGLIGAMPDIPTSYPALPSAAQLSVTTVHVHHHHNDFRGAVVTQDLIDHANAAAGAAYTESVKHTNRSIRDIYRPRL